MNIKEMLIQTLETGFPNYPVFLQGTINENIDYPDNFITVWTSFTADDEHYDNNVNAWEWHFSVIFYSNNPALVNSVPDEIMQVLKNAGFILDGKGNDIPSDTPTHTGWVLDVIYKEFNN